VTKDPAAAGDPRIPRRETEDIRVGERSAGEGADRGEGTRTACPRLTPAVYVVKYSPLEEAMRPGQQPGSSQVWTKEAGGRNWIS